MECVVWVWSHVPAFELLFYDANFCSEWRSLSCSYNTRTHIICLTLKLNSSTHLQLVDSVPCRSAASPANTTTCTPLSPRTPHLLWRSAQKHALRQNIRIINDYLNRPNIPFRWSHNTSKPNLYLIPCTPYHVFQFYNFCLINQNTLNRPRLASFCKGKLTTHFMSSSPSPLSQKNCPEYNSLLR